MTRWSPLFAHLGLELPGEGPAIACHYFFLHNGVERLCVQKKAIHVKDDMRYLSGDGLSFQALVGKRQEV